MTGAARLRAVDAWCMRRHDPHRLRRQSRLSGRRIWWSFTCGHCGETDVFSELGVRCQAIAEHNRVCGRTAMRRRDPARAMPGRRANPGVMATR